MTFISVSYAGGISFIFSEIYQRNLERKRKISSRKNTVESSLLSIFFVNFGEGNWRQAEA